MSDTPAQRELSERLPAPRVARDVPPSRDSLLAILARRASFAKYRTSPRYFRYRAGTPPESVHSVPLLADTLAMYLGDQLPTSMVARLGPSGLLRLGRVIEGGVKALGLLLRPLRWMFRRVKSLRAWKSARQHRRHIETTFMSQPPPDAGAGIGTGVLLDGRVMIEGFKADENRAQIWMRSLKPVNESCQVFLHLYPEQPSSLPQDRKVHGYLCKDHYPAVEIKQWRSDTCFRDDVNLTDVSPGYYRIEGGLIDVATFRKFPVDGSGKTSIDFGWVRIGRPAQVPAELEEVAI